jgi:autotransporter-associated beta strand protein
LAIQDQLNIDVRNVNSPSTVVGTVSGVADTLNKRGAGELQLVAANTYTGDTNVREGSLALAHNQVWSSTGTTRVAAGAQLDLQDVAVTGGRLDLQGGTLVVSQGRSLYAGPIELSANSSVKVEGTQLNLEGAIFGGGHGLNVAGSGSLVMRNEANTLSSLATTQRIGALDVSNNSALILGDIDALDAIAVRNSETLTLSTGSQLLSVNAPIVLQARRFVNQAGPQALSPGQGQNWQVWSTNATPFDAAQGDVVNGLSNDYVQYNASLGARTVQGIGRGLLYSYAPVITVNLEGQVSKLYDTTTQATLRRDHLNLGGAVHNDALTLGHFSQGEYVSAGSGLNPQGAGTSKAVNVTGLTLQAAQGAVPVYGYTMSNTVTGDVGVIQPVTLSMTIDKVYDGSELFTSSSSAKFSGMVANEAAPRLNSGSAKVGSAQAATYPIFTTSNLGVDNPNYTLNGAPVVATIQKAPLGVRAEGNYTGTTEIKPINFSVIGLVNNETLTALEKFLVSVKEVQANDTNFVTELVKAGGGGSADLANYKLNPATSTLDDATQNSVKIRALSTLILTTPAAPSVLPKVREAPGNVRTPAPVKIEEAAVIGSPAAVAVEVPVRATVTTEPAATLAPASVGSNNESGNAATSGTIKTGDVNASPDKESEANCSVGNSVQSGPGAACLRN